MPYLPIFCNCLSRRRGAENLANLSRMGLGSAALFITEREENADIMVIVLQFNVWCVHVGKINANKFK